jgi:uncharacterized protein (PEP-CTERM system associated)
MPLNPSERYQGSSARWLGMNRGLRLALVVGPALLPALAAGASLAPTLDLSANHVDFRGGIPATQRSELVTELRPGIQLRTDPGRLRGALTYSLGLLSRSRSEPSTEVRNQLAASLAGVLVDDLLFLDASATIVRAALSAQGEQSLIDRPTQNDNVREVGTVLFAPSVRGRLGGLAQYELRLEATGTDTRKSVEGDSSASGASLSLRSANSGAVVSWGLNATTRSTDFRLAGRSSTDQASASVTVRPDADVSLVVRGGRESTDLVASDRRASRTWGASATWSPSPRTLADFNTDRRFFGRSHRVGLSYRLPQSSVRFGSSRDVALSANPNALGQPATLFDLFFAQFAALESDPVRRQQLVLDFLAANGLDPTSAVESNVINRGPTVQQRHDLAWSYSGRRLTLGLQVFSNETRQIDAGVVAVDGARQRGYNGSLAYRLTPTLSLTTLGSRLMTKPGAQQAGTDLKSLAFTLTERIGRYATASVNTRYTVFNSTNNPYRETTVGVSLGLRF